MQTLTGENVFPIERTYMDVSLSTIQNTVASVSGRSSQPVLELGFHLLESAKKGDVKSVKEYISKGAPFSSDWLGTSPLHFAAQYNYAEIAKILLGAGISRDARNKVERTPLHVAAQEGHYEIVSILIEHGADVDCKDMVRMTPLHWAAENGDAEIVKLLLSSGADPSVENKFDMTPDYIAFKKERFDIVEMLREAHELDSDYRNLLKEKSVKKDLNVTKNKDVEKQGSEDGLMGKRRIQHHITRVLSNRKSPTVNELPPTPPVEDVMNESDCDRLEEELIKIANGQQMNRLEDVGKTNVFTSSTSSKSQATTKATNNAMQILNAHGITMLPVDDSSLIESAVQSGQTVILTEAGKLAFNSTKVNVMQNGSSLNSKIVNSNNLNKKPDEGGGINNVKAPRNVQVIKTKPTTIQCKKIFPISSEQLINMTKEKKVIIHNGDKKLGKPVQFVCTKPLDPVLAAKLGNITVTNATKQQNETNCSSSSPAKKLRTDETSELMKVKNELLTAKKHIQSLQELLKVKEKENKQYQLQIETLLKIRMVNK